MDAGTIQQESRAWLGNWRQSAAEVGEKPEEKRYSDAEHEARDDGEIEGSVFSAMDDVAGKPSDAEWEFAAEIKKRAEDGEKRSKHE